MQCFFDFAGQKGNSVQQSSTSILQVKKKKKKINNKLLEKANNLQQDVFSIIGLDSFDPERIWKEW